MKNDIKILHTADWHIGHIKTPTLYTINDIRKLIFPLLKDIDMMIIAGDIFDSSISYNQIDSIFFIELISNLFDLLDKYDIVLRIIRGTYTHDRDQLKNITAIYENYDYSFDFKYIEKIEIEYIEKLKTSFLYIPDDLEYSSSKQIIKYVKKQMNLQGYDYIDYMVGHGNFIHNYPKNAQLPKIVYSVDQFDFIKKLVLMGHNHFPSVYKRKIVYAGSINRLRHGEESPKGFYIIEGNKAKFIENKNAVIYKSFIINEDTDQDVLIKKLNDIVNKYFKKSKKGYLRIINCPVEFKKWIYSSFNKNHKNIYVTFSKNKENSDIKMQFPKFKSNLLENPSEKNIHTLVIKAIKKYFTKEFDHDRIKILIKEL